MTTPAASTAASPSTDRQEAILIAAFEAIATYGFRKTSMDDIARAAGMSRSSLYLSYRNKEDILRRLAGWALSAALDDVEAVLAADKGSVEEVLLAAFLAKDGKYMEAVLNTPHGYEVVEEGLAATRDIITQAEDRMRALLAGWLSRHNVPVELGTPEEVAQSIVAALSGLKATSRSFAAYREGEQRLARIFARALG